ncbi:MAG: DegV family protein [Bulleidia sp.]
MRKFTLATASTIDAHKSWLDEHNIPFISYTFELNDTVYIDDGLEETKRLLYSEMRKGNQPRTSQITVYSYYEFFRSLIEKDKNVLFMDMDRALSSSYFNSLKAAEQIKEDYPDSNLVIADTRCVTAGLALLVAHAMKLADEGKSMEEVHKWIDDNRLRVTHRFLVDDLEWLRRGGRLSNASAFFGSLLSIKPLIYVDNEGKLVAFSKIRGKKKAIRALLESSLKDMGDPAETDLILAHADVPEDIKAFEEMVREMYPTIRSISIMELGPVIGCHVGPGLMAMIYLSKENSRIA